MTEIKDTDADTLAGPPDRERAAVGLIATGDNDDDIVRAALRAKQHGYEVFLARKGAAEPVRALELLNAFDIERVGGTRNGDGEDPVRRELRTHARSRGHPGIIYYQSSGWIDFDASEDALRESRSYDVWAETLVETATVLVAIPAYNEEAEIGSVVARASEFADTVVVVDDGSSDDTVQVAENAGAVVVQHEQNRGYGGALKTIFREAYRRCADYLVIMDGDGQHDASDVPRLVDELEAGSGDIVIGSRFADETRSDVPLYRLFGLHTLNWLTNMSMGLFHPRSWLSDTQSGFRAYNERAIRSLSTDETIGDGMSASTDILYHAFENELDVGELGLTINYDVEDASTHHPLKHGFALLANVLRTIEHSHPIATLGVPGFASTLVGLGFAYWTIHVFLTFQTLPVGSAVASAFFALAGILACFTAIILHSLNTFHTNGNVSRSRNSESMAHSDGRE